MYDIQSTAPSLHPHHYLMLGNSVVTPPFNYVLDTHLCLVRILPHVTTTSGPAVRRVFAARLCEYSAHRKAMWSVGCLMFTSVLYILY